MNKYVEETEESGRTETLVQVLDELERTKTDLKNVIKVLLTVSPEHRDWVEKNWKDILEELEK